MKNAKITIYYTNRYLSAPKFVMMLLEVETAYRRITALDDGHDDDFAMRKMMMLDSL